MLPSWGMHRMGAMPAKVTEFSQLAASLRSATPAIEELWPLNITRLDPARVAEISQKTWQCERITFKFAGELDLLLERATQIDPAGRATMAEMARELRACTASPAESRRSASLDAALHPLPGGQFRVSLVPAWPAVSRGRSRRCRRGPGAARARPG